MLGCLTASRRNLSGQIPDVDVHHSKLRFNDQRKRMIVKCHNADLLRDFQFSFQDRIRTHHDVGQAENSFFS